MDSHNVGPGSGQGQSSPGEHVDGDVLGGTQRQGEGVGLET